MEDRVENARRREALLARLALMTVTLDQLSTWLDISISILNSEVWPLHTIQVIDAALFSIEEGTAPINPGSPVIVIPEGFHLSTGAMNIH